MLVAAGGAPRAGPAGGGQAAVRFMAEAAARACRNGLPLNSSISGNLKAAAAAAAAARQLRFKPKGHCPTRKLLPVNCDFKS
jgi:hypothetical protein